MIIRKKKSITIKLYKLIKTFNTLTTNVILLFEVQEASELLSGLAIRTPLNKISLVGPLLF